MRAVRIIVVVLVVEAALALVIVEATGENCRDGWLCNEDFAQAAYVLFCVVPFAALFIGLAGRKRDRDQ